jgi:hypothetical protein
MHATQEGFLASTFLQLLSSFLFFINFLFALLFDLRSQPALSLLHDGDCKLVEVPFGCHSSSGRDTKRRSQFDQIGIAHSEEEGISKIPPQHK